MTKPSRAIKELKLEKEEKSKPTWAGAQALLSPTTAGTKEDKEKKLVIWTARALGVSPFGVNILSGMPYPNKLGLRQKAEEYHGEIMFEYKWVKVAEDDTQKAICECRMIKNGKPLTDYILGECSPSTIRMGTLKGYQNHMAQTRARNRCIWEIDGSRIHEDLIRGIERLQAEKTINSQTAEKIMKGSQTSAEEMELPDKPIGITLQNAEGEVAMLYEFAHKKGAVLGQERQWIEKTVRHSIDWDTMSLSKALELKTEILLKSNGN
jgi:hypothetical protein